MAVPVKTKKGKRFVLLNPKEKAEKYKAEMKNDFKVTNDAVIKTDRFGNQIGLTNEERAYRAGYREAYKDCAKAYYSKKHR